MSRHWQGSRLQTGIKNWCYGQYGLWFRENPFLLVSKTTYLVIMKQQIGPRHIRQNVLLWPTGVQYWPFENIPNSTCCSVLLSYCLNCVINCENDSPHNTPDSGCTKRNSVHILFGLQKQFVLRFFKILIIIHQLTVIKSTYWSITAMSGFGEWSFFCPVQFETWSIASFQNNIFKWLSAVLLQFIQFALYLLTSS